MKKVSVKNRQFAYEVKGTISPTVVLETGIGAESGAEGHFVQRDDPDRIVMAIGASLRGRRLDVDDVLTSGTLSHS